VQDYHTIPETRNGFELLLSILLRSTVLPTLNRILRERAPGFHRQIRRAIRWWFIESRPDIESSPALPRKVGGAWCWLHPRFLAESLDLEPKVQAVFRERIRPGDTVIDIGAYVGTHTLLASHLAGPNGHVFAFEPSPINFRYLAYHCLKNAPARAHAFRCLVSDRADARVPFLLLNSGDSSTNSMTFNQLESSTAVSSPTETIEVESVTLDGFCAERQLKPSFIKIDVEGAEFQVLKGSERILREARPTIVVALHPPWMPKGTSPKQLWELLSGARYEVATIDGRPTDDSAFAEYLCLPRS
jgi:FkbM family methyltransferase